MDRITVCERSVPGVGKLRELDTQDGSTVTVVVHRSGGCDLGLRAGEADEAAATVGPTDAEAVAIAALLTGAAVFVERDAQDEPVG